MIVIYGCVDCGAVSEFVITNNGACDRIEHKLNCEYTLLNHWHIQVMREWVDDGKGNLVIKLKSEE